MWGNFGPFVVLAQNCLAHTLDYMVMQMRKTNQEKGHWHKKEIYFFRRMHVSLSVKELSVLWRELMRIWILIVCLTWKRQRRPWFITRMQKQCICVITLVLRYVFFCFVHFHKDNETDSKNNYCKIRSDSPLTVVISIMIMPIQVSWEIHGHEWQRPWNLEPHLHDHERWDHFFYKIFL